MALQVGSTLKTAPNAAATSAKADVNQCQSALRTFFALDQTLRPYRGQQDGDIDKIENQYHSQQGIPP
ncbi:MAG: hypothetical protein IV104_21730 [Acidovorax sp.]|nr:hypothetical protein [Acidovorax sp.]